MFEHLEQLFASENDFTQCQRLFHGRGHAFKNYEHINIDWFPPVAVVILYKESDKDWLQSLAQQLKSNLPRCHSVQVQYRFLKQSPYEVLLGEAIAQSVVEEAGLKYHIQFGKTQNPGLFLDMSNGRQWVREHAKDKNVLNMFAYTCAFSVAAIAGGAGQVVNVDNNKGVLSRGRENHRLNEQDIRKIKFEGVNIFTSWSRIRKYAPYDLLICDPPVFQVGSVKIERDYKKIVSRIPQFMKPGSDIMLCLNSPDLSDKFMHDMVAESCPECVFQQEIKPPAIFKEAVEGKGLKVLLYRYEP